MKKCKRHHWKDGWICEKCGLRKADYITQRGKRMMDEMIYVEEPKGIPMPPEIKKRIGKSLDRD